MFQILLPGIQVLFEINPEEYEGLLSNDNWEDNFDMDLESDNIAIVEL
jgi:hypothetical protein